LSRSRRDKKTGHQRPKRKCTAQVTVRRIGGYSMLLGVRRRGREPVRHYAYAPLCQRRNRSGRVENRANDGQCGSIWAAIQAEPVRPLVVWRPNLHFHVGNAGPRVSSSQDPPVPARWLGRWRGRARCWRESALAVAVDWR
jgi:hypothetical protein